MNNLNAFVPPTADEIAQFRARTIEAADRSWINDRLVVDLPEHLHGEWHSTDHGTQMISQATGFVDGSEYLSERNVIHDGPDGKTVGDVKFMVIPKWKYQVIQEEKLREADRRSGLNADYQGDQDRALAQQIGLGVENERSTGRLITGDELNAQLPRG